MTVGDTVGANWRRMAALGRSVGGLALAMQIGCMHAANGERTPASTLQDPSVPSVTPTAPSVSLDAVAADQARTMFSKAISCPEDRVTVTPTTATAETPLPEVSADPERLAVWRQNRVADPRKWFDVSGCDRHTRVACNVFPGTARRAPDAFCLPQFDPGAVAGKVLLDPAVRQKAFEQLEGMKSALPAGPTLGIRFSAVPGLGLVVDAVLPGGPADGKLRPADIVIAAAGQVVADAASLQAIVGTHAGKPVELRVRRDGQETTVTVNVPSL
jgi:hypothetical protein